MVMTMRRWLPVVLVALVTAVVGAGCGPEKADDTDRQRIEAMKSEPVVAGLDGVAHEGAADGGDYSTNSYSAYPVSKAKAASAAAARTQAGKVVEQLRAQGWTVVSDRCTVPGPGSYQWEAYAYKMRESVPYGAKLTGSYSLDSGLTVGLVQEAPFHADTKVRFQPAPPALAQTCVEQGDVDHPATPQGTTWSLT
jgi:hypothetical protein